MKLSLAFILVTSCTSPNLDQYPSCPSGMSIDDHCLSIGQPYSYVPGSASVVLKCHDLKLDHACDSFSSYVLNQQGAIASWCGDLGLYLDNYAYWQCGDVLMVGMIRASN